MTTAITGKEVKVKVKENKYDYPYKRILVFPDRTLRASILEMAMIDTRIMQRLRNTKQLGNSNVSYPTADHSRFAHSLGVLYWSTKILTSLKDNYNAEGNKKTLAEFDRIIRKHLKDKLSQTVKSDIFDKEEYLGVSWFEQLVRMYALLHDLPHIPYGHTLEDQAGMFIRHDENLPRLEIVFEMLKKEVNESYHFEKSNMGDTLAKIATEYIELVKMIFVMGAITSDPDSNDKYRSKWIERWKTIDTAIHKPLLLSYDIVSNTICADLMDYTLRDTLFASMPKTFDKALLTSMKIVEYKTTFYQDTKISVTMSRLGVNISRKKIRHDIITAILDLLRIRYDLTEKVYYHHTKVITDAMLEKIIRSLPSDEKGQLGYSDDEAKLLSFKPEDIYKQYLGDEGFLILLENKLKLNDRLSASSEILNKILSRNLYKTIFRINRNEALSPAGRSTIGTCDTPEGRENIEKMIVSELSGKHGANIKEGDIIISCPPKKMQMKIAKALIQWFDEQIYTFKDLPLETNYSDEVGLLTQRYSTLWSMNVFLNPEKVEYIRLVESVCEDLFEIRNESILHNYLKQRYSEYYESQNTMTEIKHRVIAREATVIKSYAAKGYVSTEEKVENTEQEYYTTLEERKQLSSKKVKLKKQKPEESSQVIGFKDS